MSGHHQQAALSTQKETVSSDVWHRRLGHTSFEKLRNLFLKASIDSCNKVAPCDVCIR
ncbi:hypothetical protein LINGRAHAP2_LOCUS8118, partial [Linum grandiflorum]